MINVLDIETYKKDDLVIPYCICILLNDRIYYHYADENIVINCLNTIVNNCFKNKCEIYIHNINFDGIIVIEQLCKYHIKYDIISDKTNLYCLKIFYCNVVILFKCSYKIIPESLNKLSLDKSFKKSKFPYKFVNEFNLYYIGKTPSFHYWENDDYFSYLESNKSNLFNLKIECIKYCINDILITSDVLKNIFKIVDSEDIFVRRRCLSAPSISHKIFYKKYNTLNIDIDLKIEDDSYLRNSYYGGRCEVFGNIKTGEYIKYFDFSGMYAQCMLEKFHCGKGYYAKSTNLDKQGFYNIDYESNFDFLPVLPMHLNGKMNFYNGKRNGTFWFEEIKLFEKIGGKIIKINNSYLYDNYDFVFKDFIERFSKIREKGGYYKIFGKLMINSLYGSMALKKKETFQYITFSYDEFCNINTEMNVEKFYKISSCYIMLIKIDYKSKKFFNAHNDNEVLYSKRNVSYASAISSKARIKLYKAMLDVIEDGGRLLYCDTDSIFAAYPLSNKKNNFNGFKWLDFYDDGVFMCPKTYAVKKENTEIIKIKGVSVKNIKMDQLKKNFYEDSFSIFSDQLIFNKRNFTLEQLYINKRIAFNNYDKRCFIDNKKNTKPILY